MFFFLIVVSKGLLGFTLVCLDFVVVIFFNRLFNKVVFVISVLMYGFWGWLASVFGFTKKLTVNLSWMIWITFSGLQQIQVSSAVDQAFHFGCEEAARQSAAVPSTTSGLQLCRWQIPNLERPCGQWPWPSLNGRMMSDEDSPQTGIKKSYWEKERPSRKLRSPLGFSIWPMVRWWIKQLVMFDGWFMIPPMDPERFSCPFEPCGSVLSDVRHAFQYSPWSHIWSQRTLRRSATESSEKCEVIEHG